MSAQRRLRTVLVVPSRYDERGVMVFHVGISHNGSVCTIAGLIEDLNQRNAGRIDVDYEIFDEHVERAVTARMLRRWRDDAEADGRRFVLMLCGVQTTNYPRGRDLALMARREGIQVIAGGVHLSCHGPSVDFLISCGVSVGIGEVEPLWGRIIDDALNGALQPIYRIEEGEGELTKTAVSDIRTPPLEELPWPEIPRSYLKRFLNRRQVCVDASRGCPYLCSFCTVKNVFGRTVRGRPPQVLADWIAERYDRDGIRWFAFSDDNFPRNPGYEEILEALAQKRESGRRFFLNMLVDVESTCYFEEDSKRGERTRRFLELCRRAGVARVYVGLESTSDEVLREMRKNVNLARKVAPGEERRRTLERYKASVRGWQSIGTIVECGIIMGFDADDREVGARTARDMVDIGVDVAHFTLNTPLPGAEDYVKAKAQDRLLDTDFNAYFFKPLLGHPRLKVEELVACVGEAAEHFHSVRNTSERILRGVLGIGRARVMHPGSYIVRQVGAKVMATQGMYNYFQAGLIRKPARYSEPRRAVTDEEARRYYLGETAPEHRDLLPEVMRDDSVMESMPILARNALRYPAAAPA